MAPALEAALQYVGASFWLRCHLNRGFHAAIVPLLCSSSHLPRRQGHVSLSMSSSIPSQLEWQKLILQQNSIVDQQTKVFLQVIDANKTLEEKVNKTEQGFDDLRREIELWKKAYIQEQQESEQAKRDATTLRTQLADCERNKDRDPIVLALIDGDGYIFKDELLKRGLDGGREAAQILNENIVAHISQEEKSIGSRVQVWTYVFFNLKGLKQTLVGCDICTCSEFDAFVMGFSQANPRFTIYDAHVGKEAADAKIRAYLQTWTRFSQTVKVYFGGGHDNGYHPTLAELQNDGLLKKIVLLQGYEQVAAEIRSLHIPTLKIEDLFRLRPHKVQVSGKPFVMKWASMPSPPSSASSSPIMSHTNVKSTTPNNTSSNGGKSRFPSPNVELHKNNPPPCNLFYLANCNRAAECRYSHDYILDADQYAMLRENARKSPCPAINTDSPCPYGEKCALGHKCPSGPQCYYRKVDKCWFKGKSMHVL